VKAVKGLKAVERSFPFVVAFLHIFCLGALKHMCPSMQAYAPMFWQCKHAH